MSGYYLMHRDWQDNPLFGNEPHSQRDAWIWLIEQAAWRPTRARVKGVVIELERGQLCFSQRFMAEKWQWSKSRVDRFLKKLGDEGMIETCAKNGATPGHPAGQGQSIITICNYDKYQITDAEVRGNNEPVAGATAGQQRGNSGAKKNEGNTGKEIEEEEDASAPAASPANSIISRWNSMASSCGLRKAEKLTTKRRAAIRNRVDDYTEAVILEAIAAVPGKPWLIGMNDRNWRADIDWLLQPDSITKIREGKYDHGNRSRPANDQPASPASAIATARRRLGFDRQFEPG